MFDPLIYKNRRRVLKENIESGILLFLGNRNAPINAEGNVYPFRQDSSFLYFFGLDRPHLAGLIDVESGEEILFGVEPDWDDLIFNGGAPDLEALKTRAGVDQALPLSKLPQFLEKTQKSHRMVHYLPPYRGETKVWLLALLGIHPGQAIEKASAGLIQEVVRLREIKSDAEIREIEKAVDLTGEMIKKTVELIKPGMSELSVASSAAAVANAVSTTSFPVILTKNGQYLHALPGPTILADGDLLIQDCGGESEMHYAGDITRTIPVRRTFSQQQKMIYQIVFQAQEIAMAAVAPGVKFRSIHRKVSRFLCESLTAAGLMKGDPIEAEENGAHALFFPCGLGHPLGLDVHDMESLGEENVGYTREITRSSQFGLNRLRLAKPLKPGMVMTIEPGIYFIPELIEHWQQNSINADFINFSELTSFLDFGGVRLEDDVLVTPSGARILGQPIPRTIEEVENAMASG